MPRVIVGAVTSAWDRAYLGAEPAGWDIGRPQPVFARLAHEGLLAGRVLDAGCGTGEHALLAAASGVDVTGVDISPAAIDLARSKAQARGLSVRFEVGDALDLASLRRSFDVVIDSGLFHVFQDEDRSRYVTSLASVLAPGGTCYLVCISDRQPGEFKRPRRVRQDELHAAFADGWLVSSIDATSFELNQGPGICAFQAWLATIIRA